MARSTDACTSVTPPSGATAAAIPLATWSTSSGQVVACRARPLEPDSIVSTPSTPGAAARDGAEHGLMATTQTPSATTQRLEAFSDGVIAIAITLLVLQIKIPNVD